MTPEQEEQAVAPTVQAFLEYLEAHGPEAAQGLLAGLVKLLDQSTEQPFQQSPVTGYAPP